jgi:probable HAF family extracellular repeat protein
MTRIRRLPTLVAVLITSLVAVVTAAGAAQAGPAPSPYTLVDPGTLGGPQSFMNLPGSPTTSSGALIGTADTGVADSDYPNFNPFIVGFPDPFTAHAFSYENGRMTDLGALPGNNSSAVFQVNGNGVGAGMSEDGTIDPITGWPSEHATLFKNGRLIDLGTLPGGYEAQAVGINDHGQAAGFASNGTEDPFSIFGWGTQVRSFVWQGSGPLRDIGTLGGPDAVMTGINERGQVYGVSYTNSTPNDTTGIPTLHSFIWEKGRMRDLGSLGGAYTEAASMNDAGQVVGLSTLEGDNAGHPYLWDGRRMVDLGTLGGDFGTALAVNDEGHATGFSFRGDGTYHAFLWANGKLRDLAPPEGYDCAAAFAINNVDDIVGTAQDCQGNNLAPVLWHNGVPYDLSTLVAPTDFVLDEPEFIDDEGRIVGHGFDADGNALEFMLVPDRHARVVVAASSDLASPSVVRAGTTPRPSRLCAQVPVAPLFSPDGRSIACAKGPEGGNGKVDVFTMRLDGSGVHRIARSPLWDSAPDWGKGSWPEPS